MAGIVGLEPTRAGVKVLCLHRLGYIPSYHNSIPYPQAFVKHFKGIFIFAHFSLYKWSKPYIYTLIYVEK